MFKEDYYIITDPISNFFEKNNLNLSQKLKIALDLALSIQYLHKNGLFFNFSSNNLFLDKEYNLKIFDFELDSKLSLDPYFYSPEVLESNLYTIYSDTFGFGSFLYVLFHIEKPFDGISQDRIKEMIIKVKNF